MRDFWIVTVPFFIQHSPRRRAQLKQEVRAHLKAAGYTTDQWRFATEEQARAKYQQILDRSGVSLTVTRGSTL